MDKKVIATFAATLILFGFLNFVSVNFLGLPFSPVAITGYAVVNDTGIVAITVTKLLNVFIYSPQNISYDFDKGDPYIIELNVSADFTVEPVDGWKYWLYDIVHDNYTEVGTLFTPNSSITAVRWGNELTVSALSDEGQWVNETVVFYVNVNNSNPLLGYIPDTIYACEGEAFNYPLNATDVDEDDLTVDISPKNPFYVSSPIRIGQVSFFNITSGILRKSRLARSPYSEVVSVLDSLLDPDSKAFDIEIIEINNPPVIENIGAQTVWLTGENSTFYHVFSANDTEDGNTSDGNLRFNLTFNPPVDVFNIGLNNGTINHTPKTWENGSVYNLTVCVTDNALTSPHANISLCSGDWVNQSDCDTFSLTVTDENRAPKILNYTPTAGTFDAVGTEVVLYNVSVYDADGTIPDIDWYADGALVEHNENVSVDSLSYAFACGLSGAHTLEVIATDGLLSASHIWYVDVEKFECPVSSSGGGGGGDPDYCSEDWHCDDWNVCQNVERSFDSGVLSLEDYSVARAACLQNKEEDERFCGFQVTQCHDLKECENEEFIFEKPIERRFCYFTENPSCTDGITNCHDGSCEILADCGGPCDACPSCSDGEQNQGEAGVDCGGPCPYLCEPEVPFAAISSVLIVIAIVLVIIIIWVLWKLFLLWKRKKEDEHSFN